MMTITKERRGYWQVEPATGNIYASIEMRADFDSSGKWFSGWHVRFRDKTSGAVVEKGRCFASRDLATASALDGLTPGNWRMIG
jgi:hypothetical protein